MTTTNHPASSPRGKSSLGASVAFACTGGCGLLVPDARGPLSYCGTCRKVHQTLTRERATSLHELARRGCPRERSYARIADLIRRTGVDDAEELIGQLRLR